MASEKTGKDGFTEVTGNGDDGWSEVSAESQLVFDTIGDEWIGTFLGMEQVGSKGMWQAHFEQDGDLYFTNTGYDLRKKLEKVPVKSLVKMRYDADQDTGQDKPMKVFKVWHK
jgi:hypothetical protein